MRSPTQAIFPAGRTKTAGGAATSPRTGRSHPLPDGPRGRMDNLARIRADGTLAGIRGGRCTGLGLSSAFLVLVAPRSRHRIVSLLGVPPLIAIASPLPATIPGAITAAVAYVRSRGRTRASGCGLDTSRRDPGGDPRRIPLPPRRWIEFARCVRSRPGGRRLARAAADS